MMANFFSLPLMFILYTLCADHTFAADIKIPTELPQLNATADKDLGTLADNTGLAIGSVVDNFIITDSSGKNVSFSDLERKGPLLVIFYRGGWCPYCNRQIRALSMAWPEFKKRHVLPVLISVDKPDAAAMAQKTYEIPFPVLSDPLLEAHKAFNVVMRLDDKLLPMYKKYGIALEDWSGQNHHKFAVASAFIIDTQAKVVWAHSAEDYKTRPTVEQLLQVIDGLKM